MPVRRSLERQLLLGFTLPVLAIITVTVLSLTAFYEYRRHAQTVTHTWDVINQVRTLQILERQWLIAPTDDCARRSTAPGPRRSRWCGTIRRSGSGYGSGVTTCSGPRVRP